MNRLPLFLLLIATLTLQHCTGASGGSAADAEQVLHLVEEVRIGSLDGEEEYMFGRISSVRPGEDGKIIVADSQIPVIRMYDSEGNYLKDVGGEGRGPGEYSGILGMSSFPDRGFAISDSRNSRVTIYDSQGEVESSHTVQIGLHSADVFRVDHQGNFYIKSVYPHTIRTDQWEFFWKKYSRDGELADTLDVPLNPNTGDGFVLFTASGAAYSFFEQPHFALSPLGYIVHGMKDRYRLEWVDEGDTVVVEREYEPVALKPEEREQWQKSASRFDDTYLIPETKPAYKDIRIDSQGRIWVFRYVEAELTDRNGSGSTEQWWERPTYDVLMPDGSFHATVVFPWRVTFEDALHDRVWGILTGEMGEEYAVRFRMEEITAGN